MPGQCFIHCAMPLGQRSTILETQIGFNVWKLPFGELFTKRKVTAALFESQRCKHDRCKKMQMRSFYFIFVFTPNRTFPVFGAKFCPQFFVACIIKLILEWLTKKVCCCCEVLYCTQLLDTFKHYLQRMQRNSLKALAR